MSISKEGKILYGETRRIIRDAKDNNRLVLFVGAGVSMGSGMPSWNVSVEQIASRLPLTDKDKPYDALKIPQYYYNSRGKKEYTQLMREVFLYGQPLKTNPLHKKIVECHAETIITTNYDHLIEQASEENAEVRYVISSDSDLPYKNTSRELVKMHGDFENDNFVLKEDDYLQYSNHFRLIETYIKSLIGSRVVLFVGYSLNDPDVKQIFSWVKDALKDDYQRAYLILSGREKNEIERDYFRNLGVNIIYASELIENWENIKDNHTEQLIEVFDYILEDEEKKTLDRVYNELKPLQNLNYVYGKYIRKSLIRLGISCENDTIDLSEHALPSENENEKFKFLLWTYINGEQTPELKALDNSDCEKLRVIKNVLSKSCFQTAIRKVDRRFLKVQLSADIYNEIEDSVYKFDYKNLDCIKNHNSTKLTNDVPELYMQQAYISVLLNDNYTAYNCLKNAAKIYYHDRNFVWYFLSEFNRKYVGRVCLNAFSEPMLSEDERKQLDVEVKAIDIDQILATIPDLGQNHNEFLSELGNFKVSYSLFYDMFADAMKANEQAKTAYSFFAGTAAYENMRNNAKDYNNYETRNYIMLDRYNEVRSIFLLYLRSIFSSVMAEDMPELLSDEEIFRTGNIKEDKLKPFDFYIMIRYLTQSDIKKLFKEYDIKFLPVDTTAFQYIEEISDSIFTARDYVKYSFISHDIFWSYLEVISHLEVSDNLAVKVLRHLSGILSETDLISYKDSINRFVVNLCKDAYFQNPDVSKFSKQIIDNILDILINDPDNQIFDNILSNLSYICKQSGNAYDNMKKFKKVIASCGDNIGVNLYSNLGENCQIELIHQFNGWKPKDSANDFCLYCDAVLSEIIKPDISIEKRIYGWIKQNAFQKNNDQNTALIVMPRPLNYSDIIKELVNLFLNNQIQNVESLRECVSQFGDSMSQWLLNISEYNYDLFDCNWLDLCRPGLLRSIARDEIANKSIREAYKKQYESKNVKNTIGDIIIRYFIADLDEVVDIE